MKNDIQQLHCRNWFSQILLGQKKDFVNPSRAFLWLSKILVELVTGLN